MLQMSESLILAIRNPGCHYGSVLGGDRLDIQILAPIPRILVANRSVDAGSPKGRLILAVLAESVGRVVPTPILIEHVWGQHPPDAVQSSVQSYFSRIRTALREAGAQADIVRRGQGYLLETDPECVDWHRARRWSDQARKLIRRGENERAAALLEDALDLWQGDPFTEFGGLWADSLRRSMARTRTRILGDWAGVKIELGQHEEVLDHLEDHLPDETLTLHHMKALAASGRHTEALGCYSELREHTLGELGSEPNPRVRSLFQRLLNEEVREDEVLRTGPDPVQERGRGPEVIDTLQADVADFLGREEELGQLLTSAREARGRTLVQVVTGIGGAGKTTLAVHAAHILRNEFDVRLQTDLSEAGTEQILFRLLQMLGVPGGSIPAEREARVAMWRKQIAGRRVLLLLDNASHQSQVVSAVPGTPGSLVLVTSRRSLSELAGARQVGLRELDEEDAAQMFAAFSGRGAEDPGMHRVVGLTGGLPIVLRVASSQLRVRPKQSLDYLARRLERQGQAAVKGADWEAIAVFASSYEALSPQTQRTFLHVGLQPTPVVPDHAVAASVGYWDETDASLDDLLDVHLLQEVSPGRYRMHDLVRKFAHQQAARVMSDRERSEVERRTFEYYLATADNADRAARPGRRRTDRPITRGAAVQTFDSPREAREWFADYFPAVESVIEHARSLGYTEYVAELPLAMAGLLESNGPWDRAEQLFTRAADAWRELGDSVGLADSLYELALMRLNLKALDEAEGLLNSASELWEAAGRRENIPYAQDQIAMLHAERGDHVRAVSGYKVALEAFQLLGDQRGVAKVLNHLALSHSDTAKHELASSFFLVSKQIYQALGDRQMETAVAMNLFRLRFGEGRHREARAMNERCRQVYEENGDVLGVAGTYRNRGLLELYLNRYGEALECFGAARRGFWGAADVSGVTRSMAGMGEALLGLGRLAEAEEVLRDGLVQARARKLSMPESPLLRALGDVFLARHLGSEARKMYEGSLNAAARSASIVNEGLAYSRLGDFSSLEGDPDQALAYWGQAAQVLERAPTPYLAHVHSKIEWCLYVQGQIAS